MKVSINMESDIIISTLEKIIKHDNSDIRVLIKDMFENDQRAIELVAKLLIGDKLPEKPKVGDTGYIKLDGLYFSNKKHTIDTDLDEKGYIKCVVKTVNGYTYYAQLYVEAKVYNEFGEIVSEEISCQFDKFIIEESI
jgi:hypothetical protein